ncbi:hypothetical protein CMQ_1442 [Grosmannia clavigera kw1407]|uniref:Zinc fyve domain containing protein n=1 Tax=Grosmannia clavigera (strain kw1407 / UAMH 11150) TaxID=655863 RepID=F0XCH4_GROCL|nr:uncharacterized protein CMQ_1442 [Grosmannia clavigera kw1407]EFX04514.1 hypothetical protein CMQ_1442 [Grosmannia clavigera kw1407]
MDSSAADRSLLDRLNALKPSGVVLDRPSQTAADAPEARADALAARLRLLRQHSEPQADGKRQVVSNADPSSPLPPTAPSAVQGHHDEDDDPLLFSDERALNDFLLDDEDDDNGSFVLLPDVPRQLSQDADDADDADDEKKVADLLGSLAGPGAEGSQAQPSSRRSDESDESDGDNMDREVRRVVSQARDEARADAGEPDDSSDLQLPAVPTELVDRPERDAADDIAERLAALRGLSGPDAGLGHTDAFGLPSAPTFRPGDDRKKPGSSSSRFGYTEEDRRSWCVVCLEDAAVRCLGCDDDPYCARCWREMHVGPAAGFDERGHKRVPLSRASQP